MIRAVTPIRFGIVLALAAAALMACGNSGGKTTSASAKAAAPGGAAAAVMVSYFRIRQDPENQHGLQNGHD